MKKKILIIGSGVLGAYLAKIFLEKQNNFKIFVSSRYLKKKYKNYRYLKIDKKVKFIKLDILNVSQINKKLIHLKPDAIYYFSGQSSIYKSYLKKKSTIDSNFRGAKIFLNLIFKNKLQTKFFKANSGYIFKSLRYTDNFQYSLVKPYNPYISSQIKAFKEIKRYRGLGVNCYSLIFFNVESPLKPPSFILNKVCNFVRREKRTTLKLGNINVIRDFSWAPEIMKGVFHVFDSKPQDIIFASGKNYNLKDMIKFFFKLKKLNFAKHIKIDKKLYRKNEKINVSITNFRRNKLLVKSNWVPKIYGEKLIKKLYFSKKL